MKDCIRKYYVHICFAVSFLILLWRSFKGFCWTDESFYVSTADRFVRGAIPLVDEWYRTQLSSIVMVPFLAIYKMIAGYNGVILYFRILYLLLATAVAIVWYRIISARYPKYAALFTSVIIMFYAHLGNATFSYYMLSEQFMLLFIILVYDHARVKKRGRLAAAGVFLALSVMCMPAFAALAVPAALLCIIALILASLNILPKGVSEAVRAVHLKEIVIYTCAGMAVPAAAFGIYLFTHTDISYLTGVLPTALVDNEHTNTLGYYIRKPHRCLTEVFGSWTYVSYALIAVSFVFQKFLKKHPVKETVAVFDVILFAVMAYISYGHTGYIQVCFFLFFIPLFFISEKKDKALFYLSVIPSVAVAVIYCFVSSDFLYVMALGAALSTGAGICTVCNAAGDDRLPKLLPGALFAVCAATLFVTMLLRITNVYRDAPVRALTKRIPSGVAMGLYTTPEHHRQYEQVYDVIEKYCTDPDKKVLFSKILPWGYIASKGGCGYPTTWRATAYDADQLDIYYKMDTTRAPDVIIVLDTPIASYDASGDVEDDHNPNLDEMSGYWKDYIRDRGLEPVKESCATVYR